MSVIVSIFLSKMKVFAVLGVALVLFQVANADISQEISEGVSECANKQKLDKKYVTTLGNEVKLPEDNAEYNEFFGCVSTKLGTVDENGDTVTERLKDVLQHILKKRLGDTPDVDAKVQHIVFETLEKCKDTPKGDSVGQSVVKMRNCIRPEFQKAELH